MENICGFSFRLNFIHLLIAGTLAISFLVGQFNHALIPNINTSMTHIKIDCQLILLFKAAAEFFTGYTNKFTKTVFLFPAQFRCCDARFVLIMGHLYFNISVHGKQNPLIQQSRWYFSLFNYKSLRKLNATNENNGCCCAPTWKKAMTQF